MKRPLKAGFTLIELLVVIAVIGILVGVSTSIFRTTAGSPAAMRSGQALLNSMVSAARAQAATSGREAVLFVNTEVDKPEKFLRHIQIALRARGLNSYEPFGEGITLPDGIFVVPSMEMTSEHSFLNLAGAFGGGENWTTPNLRSTALQAAVQPLGASGTIGYGLQVTPTGTVNTPGNIVLASGSGAAAGIVLRGRESVRGILLNAYGVSILANNYTSFNP